MQVETAGAPVFTGFHVVFAFSGLLPDSQTPPNEGR